MYKARMIEKSAKIYCSLKWKEEEDLLKDTIRNLKGWKKNLIEDDWTWMLDKEEDVFELIYKRESLGDEKRINKCYSSLFEEMKKHPKLLDEIQKHIHKDKLYDIYKVVGGNDGLKAVLNHENLYLFYRLTLRFNIIMCNLISELKPEFERWMKSVDDVEPWKKDLLGYVEPLREHYIGKDFDGLWKELVENNNIEKGDEKQKKSFCLFECRSDNSKTSFDKVAVQNIVGSMSIREMFKVKTKKDIARYLENGTDNVESCYAQILKAIEKSTLDDENKKKIYKILDKYK